MSRMKTKEITLGKFAVRIGKLGAEDALWILNTLMAASVAKQKPSAENEEAGPEPKDDAEREEMANSFVSILWLTGGSELDRAKHREIQHLCFKTCSVKNERSGHYEQLMDAIGRWVRPEVAEEPALVSALVMETLHFNLAPFFLEDALSAADAAEPESRPFIASK